MRSTTPLLVASSWLAEGLRYGAWSVLLLMVPNLIYNMVTPTVPVAEFICPLGVAVLRSGYSLGGSHR